MVTLSLPLEEEEEKRVRKTEKHREAGFTPTLLQDAMAFPIVLEDSEGDTRTETVF